MRESSSSRGEILDGSVPQAGFEASPETAPWWCRAAWLHRCHRAFAPQDTPGFGLHVLQKPWSASPTSAYAGREIVPDVTLDLEYKTETLVRSLIPAFTRYSRHVVFRQNPRLPKVRPEFSVEFPRTTQPELPPLPSWPDFPFFNALEPGVILHRLNRLTVPIGERQHGTLTPGQEYFVEVEINHWPEPLDDGQARREAWKDLGELLIDKVKAAPLIVRVDSPLPAIQPCGVQID